MVDLLKIWLQYRIKFSFSLRPSAVWNARHDAKLTREGALRSSVSALPLRRSLSKIMACVFSRPPSTHVNYFTSAFLLLSSLCTALSLRRSQPVLPDRKFVSGAWDGCESSIDLPRKEVTCSRRRLKRCLFSHHWLRVCCFKAFYNKDTMAWHQPQTVRQRSIFQWTSPHTAASPKNIL